MNASRLSKLTKHVLQVSLT